MFISQRRPPEPGELVGQFTAEEAVRITQLQGLFRTYPVCYTLDINYQRLEFARWLVEHGRLDEWSGERADTNDAAPNRPLTDYRWRRA